MKKDVVYSTESYFEERHEFFKLIGDASSYATGQISKAKKAKDHQGIRFWVDMQRILAHSGRDFGQHIRDVQNGKYTSCD